MSPCTPVAPILNLDSNFVAFSLRLSLLAGRGRDERPFRELHNTRFQFVKLRVVCMGKNSEADNVISGKMNVNPIERRAVNTDQVKRRTFVKTVV